jgi:hypothetical protein
MKSALSLMLIVCLVASALPMTAHADQHVLEPTARTRCGRSSCGSARSRPDRERYFGRPGFGVQFRHDGSVLHRSSDGSAHIYGHSVVEEEVEDVLARPMEDRAGRDGSRIALGQTEAGRYLRVIYVPDPTPGSVFVITAYELGEKAPKTLQRRRKALQRRQKSSKRKKP